MQALTNYKIIRSHRRTISIEIMMDGSMIVRAPYRYSLQKIQQFIDKKEKWVQKVLSQQSERVTLTVPEIIQEGTRLPYLGSWYPVHWFDQKEPLIQQYFLLPKKWDYKNPQKKLVRWLKKTAQTYFEMRTKYFADYFKLQVHSITITNAKKRLGSCNRKKDIRYTWRLLMLPENLSDYIILHELAHIKIHSHGKPFWDLLKSWIPDLNNRKKELKNYIIS